MGDHIAQKMIASAAEESGLLQTTEKVSTSATAGPDTQKKPNEKPDEKKVEEKNS